MKKILFILIGVAAACGFQIAGFQTVVNAAWGEDTPVTDYNLDYDSKNASMDEAPNGDLYIAMEGEYKGIHAYKSGCRIKGTLLPETTYFPSAQCITESGKHYKSLKNRRSLLFPQRFHLFQVV